MEISGFRERFQISREISGEVYEISVSGGPLGSATGLGVGLDKFCQHNFEQNR